MKKTTYSELKKSATRLAETIENRRQAFERFVDRGKSDPVFIDTMNAAKIPAALVKNFSGMIYEFIRAGLSNYKKN